MAAHFSHLTKDRPDFNERAVSVEVNLLLQLSDRIHEKETLYEQIMPPAVLINGVNDPRSVGLGGKKDVIVPAEVEEGKAMIASKQRYKDISDPEF